MALNKKAMKSKATAKAAKKKFLGKTIEHIDVTKMQGIVPVVDAMQHVHALRPVVVEIADRIAGGVGARQQAFRRRRVLGPPRAGIRVGGDPSGAGADRCEQVGIQRADLPRAVATHRMSGEIDPLGIVRKQRLRLIQHFELFMTNRRWTTPVKDTNYELKVPAGTASAA